MSAEIIQKYIKVAPPHPCTHAHTHTHTHTHLSHFLPKGNPR